MATVKASSSKYISTELGIPPRLVYRVITDAEDDFQQLPSRFPVPYPLEGACHEYENNQCFIVAYTKGCGMYFLAAERLCRFCVDQTRGPCFCLRAYVDVNAVCGKAIATTYKETHISWSMVRNTDSYMSVNTLCGKARMVARRMENINYHSDRLSVRSTDWRRMEFDSAYPKSDKSIYSLSKMFVSKMVTTTLEGVDTSTCPFLQERFDENMAIYFKEERHLLDKRLSKFRVPYVVPNSQLPLAYGYYRGQFNKRDQLCTSVPGLAMIARADRITSRGIRVVFPTSPLTEIFYEALFQHDHKPLFPQFRFVYGPNFTPSATQTSYDVEGSDYLLFKLWKNFVVKYFPDVPLKLFCPPVYTHLPYSSKVVTGYTLQFPTGCLGTTIATEIMTLSIAQTAFVEAGEIQGDGLCPLGTYDANYIKRFMRVNKPFVVNGFDYSSGSAKFANAHYLALPRIRTSLHGTFGWQLRKEIYRRFLKADVSAYKDHDHRIGDEIGGMTDRSIGLMILRHRDRNLARLLYHYDPIKFKDLETLVDEHYICFQKVVTKSGVSRDGVEVISISQYFPLRLSPR